MASLSLTALVSLAGCDARTDSAEQSSPVELGYLAARYAEAWSGQVPENLAAFYAEDGALSVNDGAPSVGREAIASTARAFMEAFPDMVVVMDSVKGDADHATFYWTWTGTNTGPGGTGRPVRLSGYEEWTLNPVGRIVESRGHYDEAEYRRQVTGE
jgi:uncharacterized protein (TIGR02246 family)